MANKKRRDKYTYPRKKETSAPGGPHSIPYPIPNPANPVVVQMVDNIFRAIPGVPNLDRSDDLPALDGPELVQPVAGQEFVRSSWVQQGISYRDYFKLGSYLGRITIDEGDIIDLTLVG